MENDKKKVKTELKRRIYNWVLALVRFIDTVPKRQSITVISHQLLRSGTSVGANYIEAQAGSSKKDFTNFIHHSLKSANESLFWLQLLKDTQAGNAQNLDELISELKEIANILASSLLTLKGKR